MKTKIIKKPVFLPDLTSEVSMGFLLSKTIIGVDEVGRGCLAGPVVAAAAILPLEALDRLHFSRGGERTTEPQAQKLPEEKMQWAPLLAVRDSKLIPEPDRAPLCELVKSFVQGFAVAEANVEEIESLNILYASQLAMERAVFALEEKLGFKADVILVDGHLVPRGFLGRGYPLIKGDMRSLTIACASIIAKVYRDEMMEELEAQYPGYGLKKHKGYPTPFHKKQIIELGVTEIHRKSFRGVKPAERLTP